MHGSLRWLFLWFIAVAFTGCATGGDGVPPYPDGSAPPDGDADAENRDTGDRDVGPTDACDPPCTGSETCRSGVCVCGATSPPRTTDCGMCGQQRQVCAGGAWVDDGACAAEGVCSPGEVDMMGAACGNCGREERRCGTDCRWSSPLCVGVGECAAGTVENESRPCTPACGGTEARSRTCSIGCTWEAFGAYSGCTTCGPVCGDGSCDGGETCAACTDCQNGHLGVGDNGDPCPGVPDGTWRCVTRTAGGIVSQVCRGGTWTSFNLSPRDCGACVCGFSDACCQAGSPSSGC